MDSHPPIMWKMLNVTAPYNEAETEMELAEGEKKKKKSEWNQESQRRWVSIILHRVKSQT